MLTYLDESYGQGLVIIGTLHIPTESEKKFLHKNFIELKHKYNFVNKSGQLKEIKYSNITSSKNLKIAKESIDLFASAYKSFFRAGVIQYSQKDLDAMRKLSKEPLPLNVKKAMIYTKIVELLIKNNYDLRKVQNGVLLMDNLVRCKGDDFDGVISRKLILSKRRYLKYMSYIDSRSESTHTIQICDLLLGSFRNSIIKTKNKYKNNFGKYVAKKLGLENNLDDWKKLKQGESEAIHPKFTVRVFNVPYRY